MKKLFLLSALISLFGWTQLRAQAQRGTTYWGGTVSLNGTLRSGKNLEPERKYSSAQHYIIPEIQWGKFVNPTTMIGLGVAYDLSWTRSTTDPTGSGVNTKNRTILQLIDVLPFVRKYKFVNERWAVFLHGEVGPTFGLRNFKSDDGSIEAYKNTFALYGLAIIPGLAYSFPGKKLSIEGYFNILSLSARYSPFREEANQSKSFSFSTGLSTSFPSSFQIRLAKNINAKTTQP